MVITDIDAFIKSVYQIHRKPLELAEEYTASGHV